MQITADLLMKAVGCPLGVAATWAQPIADACAKFEINTPQRVAAFLAQIAHESAGLTHVVENLSYRAARIRDLAAQSKPGSRWRSLGPRADELANNPEALGNAAYGGRLGNGSEASGDGFRYLGRGLIQNTGKANYEAVRDLLRETMRGCPDFVAVPDALAAPQWAALAAAAYWHEHDLNTLADRGAFDQITRRINGGDNGGDDRRERYKRARQALIKA